MRVPVAWMIVVAALASADAWATSQPCTRPDTATLPHRVPDPRDVEPPRAPTVRDVAVVSEPVRGELGIEPPEPRKTNGMESLVYVFGGIVAILVGLAFLGVRAVMRRDTIRTVPPRAVSPLAAETMTRAVANETRFIIACCAVLTTMLFATDEYLAGVVVGYVFVARVVRLVFVRRFLGDIERGIETRMHDRLLASDWGFIVVPKRIVDASISAVPAARVT